MKLPDWIPWKGAEGDSIGDFVRRWKDALLHCLPDWLRTRLDPTASQIILLLGEQEAVFCRQTDAGTQALGKLSPGGGGRELKALLKGRRSVLLVRIPRAWVLLKRVSLPAAARENLRQVIGFEMDRLTPFSAEQVFYDFRVGDSSAGSAVLPVELAVVPRSRVEHWLGLLKEAGIGPAALDADGLWERINLLPQAARPRISRIQLLTRGVIIAVFVMLLVAALRVPLWQKRRIVEELNTQVLAARRQADAVLDIQERLDSARESLDYVTARRREALPVVEALQLVTELLPDDTWLQQFDLKQQRLELRGMSAQATALIRRLEESPNLENAGFRSPVVQAQGKERFHLSARLMISGE